MCVVGTALSPKTRFQILLEPERLALGRIQERTAAPVASQIRRAVEKWIAEQGDEKPERKRASTRKRS